MLGTVKRKTNLAIFLVIAIIMSIAFSVITLTTYLSMETRTNRALKNYYASITEDSEPENTGNIFCFAVTFTNEGEEIIKSKMAFGLSQEEKLKIAQNILAFEKDSGYYSEEYKYLKGETDSGDVVCVMDMADDTSAHKTFVLHTATACTIVCTATFFTLRGAIFKGLKPLIDNISKQKRFVQDASHELKTPLAVISANIEVLEITQGKNEWTESIRRQTERLTALTSRLLSLAKASDPAVKKAMGKTDLSAIMYDTGKEFLSVSRTSELELKLDIAGDITVLGNEEDIRTLFEIMATNAFKYAKRNGKVTFSLKKSGNYVEASVSNTKDSFLPDFDSVFDRFYRADQSRSRNTGGSGLGLSIAKAIADAHDAVITADENGEDVIFSVKFKI